VRIIEAYTPERKFKELARVGMSIVYTYDRGISDSDADRLMELFKSDSLIVNKKTKKGFADIDILPMMDDIRLSVINDTDIRLETVISAQEPSLNPLLITAAVSKYMPEMAPDGVSYFRKEIYDKSMNIFR
jgi:hypothetical protein